MVILVLSLIFLYDDIYQPVNPLIATTIRGSTCVGFLGLIIICYAPGKKFIYFRENYLIPNSLPIWEVIGGFICIATITIGMVTTQVYTGTGDLPQLMLSPVTLVLLYAYATCTRVRFFSTVIFGIVYTVYYMIGWLTLLRIPITFFAEHHLFTLLILLPSYLTISYGIERVRRAQFIRRTEILKAIHLFSHVPHPTEINKASNDNEKVVLFSTLYLIV